AAKLDAQQKAMLRILPEIVPAGTTLHAFHWQDRAGGKKLHPRFIITERGGIQFDYGLDAGEGQKDTTIVILMEEDLWRVVQADYLRPSPSFDLGPGCTTEIQGRA